MGRLRNGVGVGISNIPTLTSRRPVVAPFTPLSLFASGEQGVWFDDSNITTMFQDSAGTTPVTAVEQPVGRQLDLSGNNNHRTQATSANRPTLSARYNLLTKTEDFSVSPWCTTGATALANQTTAPNGTLTASKITISFGLNEIYQQGLTGAQTSGSFTTGVYLKGLVGGEQVYLCATEGGVNYALRSSNQQTLVTLTTSWVWYTLPFGTHITTGTNGYISLTVAGFGGNANLAAVSFYAWGADLRPTNQVNSLIPFYQSVTSSTVYDTVGFPQYLKYNGSNSSLSTASIDFTATAQISAFSGVRKLNDAAAGMLIELSANYNSNTGSFYIVAPDSPNTYSLAGRGAGGINSGQSATATPYIAPITNTLIGLFNITASTNNIRVNSIDKATGTFAQGTGNYGNYPFYFGRRGGTTLPFNGQEFQTIIVGRTLTATEITNTETYVNSKTRAY